MATVYSDQGNWYTRPEDSVTKKAVAARVIPARDWNQKPQTRNFSYTVPVGNQTVADILRAVLIRPNEIVKDFWFGFEALSSGGGTAGADVGLTGDGQRYLTALNMDAAGEKRAAFVVDKMPDRTPVAQGTADVWFELKVTGEAWLAGKKIQGWVEVIGG